MAIKPPKVRPHHVELQRKVDLAKVISGIIEGLSSKEIAKTYKLSEPRVRELKKDPEVEKQIAEMSDKLVRESVATFRSKRKQLLRKSFEVLEKHLEEGNLKAVEIVLKDLDKTVIGSNEAKDIGIQIIMPTMPANNNIVNVTDEGNNE